MTAATPHQRRAIGDLIGLGPDYLPPDMTRVEATAWLARLRETPAAERRQVAAIAPARLADWRRKGIVRTQVLTNRIGLPLL